MRMAARRSDQESNRSTPQHATGQYATTWLLNDHHATPHLPEERAFLCEASVDEEHRRLRSHHHAGHLPLRARPNQRQRCRQRQQRRRPPGKERRSQQTREVGKADEVCLDALGLLAFEIYPHGSPATKRRLGMVVPWTPTLTSAQRAHTRQMLAEFLLMKRGHHSRATTVSLFSSVSSVSF